MRLKFGKEFGPAREVHAGSGYWSQDSVVQVLASPRTPSAIQVRWPGGKVVEAQIPSGATEISVDSNGKTERLR
jgi:hypothetical protein